MNIFCKNSGELHFEQGKQCFSLSLTGLSVMIIYLMTVSLASVADWSGFSVEVRAGDIIISDATIIEPPTGAPVAGGYLKLKNYGATTDFLLSASAAFCDEIQIHQTIRKNGVSRMRHLPDGIALPANTKVYLEPGGLHLMFTSLHATPSIDSSEIVELTFKDAGKVPIRFHVAREVPRGRTH